MDNNTDIHVEVNKNEVTLYHSKENNLKGHPILKDSGSKARKGDQLIITGAEIKADGGKNFTTSEIMGTLCT